jgi:hypothetical protein
VGLNSLKSLNLTIGYPNNKNKNNKNNKVKSKPLELRSRVKNISKAKYLDILSYFDQRSVYNCGILVGLWTQWSLYQY